MADFSSTEKINASWKHLFGILGTSNAQGADGKFWYEESISATHIIVPTDIWVDSVPFASTKTEAQSAPPSIVEDRASGENITISADGSDWVFNSTMTPKVGFQLTNTHPNPTYIKTITTVLDLGGGQYKVTLNNNSGVSAGFAVLQSRVYLTEDITTNGLAWFAKKEPGNLFSQTLENFIQPQRFGQGYTVRLFQANGTEIVTTQGAWIFNWQKGLLLFGTGFTATDQGYSKPLYIEGFRYVGEFGTGGVAIPGDLNDTLRYDGTSWVANSSVKADGTDLYVENRLTVDGSLVVPSGTAPTTPADPGTEGEVRYANDFIYIRTNGQWKRADLSLF